MTPEKKHRITSQTRLLVLVSIGLAAILTILAFLEIRKSIYRQIRTDFTRKAQIMAGTLQDTLDSYFDVLYSIKSLYDASDKVERREFRIFVQRLLERHAGIQALEWIPRVTQGQRSAFEAAARGEGFFEFQITERRRQGKMMPATKRAVYFPVHYVEPYIGNELALGFDLASNAKRLAAIRRSSKSGKLTATGRLTLVQEQQKQYGIIALLPVYNRNGEPDPSGKSRISLEGFVLGVFRIGEMVTSSLRSFETGTVIYSLDDRSAPPDQQLLWAHHPEKQAKSRIAPDHPQETDSADWWFQSKFDVGGRNWIIQFAPTTGYLAKYDFKAAGAILAGGLLFSGMVGYLLLALLGRSAALAGTNLSMRKEIAERKLVEKELKEKQRQTARDLEVAAGIQQSLIPAHSPKLGSIQVAWSFRPCERIGGDIFNFLQTGDTYISFYMLDVCGHGVSSALISAAVSQFLQTNCELFCEHDQKFWPKETLNRLEVVFPFERFDSFFTIACLTINYTDGNLTYSVAGNPPPILHHPQGALEILDVHGPVIGSGQNEGYRQAEKQLQPGDKIVLYTDGILDLQNSTETFFGKQRFYDALQKHGDQHPQAIVDSLTRITNKFAGNAKIRDDISLMVIEFM